MSRMQKNSRILFVANKNMNQKPHTMKTVNIVSYGAGVDSTAMILKMIDEKIPIHLVIFVDTGGELPETYDTIQYMKNYLSKKDIPFETVKNFSLVTLFERCIGRHVFPDTFK